MKCFTEQGNLLFFDRLLSHSNLPIGKESTPFELRGSIRPRQALRKSLLEGQEVEYTVGQGRKGPQATAVRAS